MSEEKQQKSAQMRFTRCQIHYDKRQDNFKLFTVMY